MSKNKGIIYYNFQFLASCISTTMVLLLLGMVLFFVISAQSLSDYVKENINVSLLLSDDMPKNDAMKLLNNIKQERYIRSAVYFSKDEALKEQSAAMGTDPKEFIGHNPFPASIELSLKSSYANPDSIKWIERSLKLNPNVIEVVYQEELLKFVNKNVQKVSIILLVIAFFMTLISMELISNTMRLSVYAKRFLIYTMKLVGASWGFIRRPFLKQSLIMGFISSLIADSLLVSGAFALIEYEPDLKAFITPLMIALICLGVLVFGILITFVSSFFSVDHYLKMRSKDAYYI